jgi:hypothetical protein
MADIFISVTAASLTLPSPPRGEDKGEGKV